MKTLRFLLVLGLATAAYAPFLRADDAKKDDDKTCDCSKDKDGKTCGVDKDCCCTGKKAEKKAEPKKN